MKLDLLKNKDLEGEIDIYLDMIIRGGLLFSQGVKFYLEGREDEFNTRLDILAKLEGTETSSSKVCRNAQSCSSSSLLSTVISAMS